MPVTLSSGPNVIEVIRMNGTVRKIHRYAVSIALLIGLLLSGAANADYLVDCGTEEGLAHALSLLVFKNTKDLVGLEGKLTLAFDKADEGKYCDGAQKLKDFRAKMDQLVGSRKTKVVEVHDGTLACLETGTRHFIDQWTKAVGGQCESEGKPPKGPRR
jgi:hypothetical protein